MVSTIWHELSGSTGTDMLFLCKQNKITALWPPVLNNDYGMATQIGWKYIKSGPIKDKGQQLSYPLPNKQKTKGRRGKNYFPFYAPRPLHLQPTKQGRR
jgi:hypothetical protein